MRTISTIHWSVSKNPAAFESNLADSLHSMSICLNNLDRREESANSYEEALELHRRLVENVPAAFAPGLARVLHHYALLLKGRGRCHEALNRPVAYISGIRLSHPVQTCLSRAGQRKRNTIDIYSLLPLEYSTRPSVFSRTTQLRPMPDNLYITSDTFAFIMLTKAQLHDL